MLLAAADVFCPGLGVTCAIDCAVMILPASAQFIRVRIRLPSEPGTQILVSPACFGSVNKPINPFSRVSFQRVRHWWQSLPARPILAAISGSPPLANALRNSTRTRNGECIPRLPYRLTPPASVPISSAPIDDKAVSGTDWVTVLIFWVVLLLRLLNVPINIPMANGTLSTCLKRTAPALSNPES